MLRRLRLGAHKAKHHIGKLRRRGPNLLTVNHKIITIDHRGGTQRCEVRSCPRLGIALAPNHLAGQRRADIFFLLFLRPQFQKCRHQHINTLTGNAAGHFRPSKLLSHNTRLQRIRLGAVAAIFFWVGTRRIAVFKQYLLPSETLFAPNRAVALRRRLVAIGLQKAAHIRTKIDIFLRKIKIHNELPWQNVRQKQGRGQYRNRCGRSI